MLLKILLLLVLAVAIYSLFRQLTIAKQDPVQPIEPRKIKHKLDDSQDIIDADFEEVANKAEQGDSDDCSVNEDLSVNKDGSD